MPWRWVSTTFFPSLWSFCSAICQLASLEAMAVLAALETTTFNCCFAWNAADKSEVRRLFTIPINTLSLQLQLTSKKHMYIFDISYCNISVGIFHAKSNCESSTSAMLVKSINAQGQLQRGAEIAALALTLDNSSVSEWLAEWELSSNILKKPQKSSEFYEVPWFFISWLCFVVSDLIPLVLESPTGLRSCSKVQSPLRQPEKESLRPVPNKMRKEEADEAENSNHLNQNWPVENFWMLGCWDVDVGYWDTATGALKISARQNPSEWDSTKTHPVKPAQVGFAEGTKNQWGSQTPMVCHCPTKFNYRGQPKPCTEGQDCVPLKELILGVPVRPWATGQLFHTHLRMKGNKIWPISIRNQEGFTVCAVKPKQVNHPNPRIFHGTIGGAQQDRIRH